MNTSVRVATPISNYEVREIHASTVSTRLRAVSYFSLQSYCTRNPSTRAAIKEGVSPRKKGKRPADSFVLFGDNEAVNVI